MESAIDSAVSKVNVALETFEAEAMEAVAAFVSGNDVFVSGTENRSATSYYRWFSTSCCKGVVLLCFYSAACRC